MSRVAHTRHMWTTARQDLATHTKAHFHLTMRACRFTQWLIKTPHAWRTTMLGPCFWLRHSVAWASVALKTQLARPLLQLHSYAHSYLHTPSLHGQLFEVYTRQVRTTSGATLHHVAMAHQKYLNWATMVTQYMCAHNQWLRMACQEAEEAYLASFRKVSRSFWGEHDRKMRDWCHHSCTRVGSEKQSLFSSAASASVQRHLENQAVQLETLSDQWLTNAWS